MSKNYFQRYIWLIELIDRRKYVSFNEISTAWMRSRLNPSGERLSERTFFNHKTAIAEDFGIEIKNDRTLGYYIDMSSIGDESVGKWMLQALCMNNVLRENADMKKFILFEKTHSDDNFLIEILTAIRNNHKISLVYQTFSETEATSRIISPYCIKYFKKRWYMLGLAENDGLKVYALERFQDMEELDETFTLPDGFDAETYFSNFYGIWVFESEPPVEIRLKATDYWAKYLHNLPLHHSQREEPLGDGYTLFTYCMVPTPDFESELLSLREVEVIEPKSFRDHIAGVISKMNDIYKRKGGNRCNKSK